jgi:isoleucyl-tRNA synthetase
MFEKVAGAEFIRGEHEILKFWSDNNVFDKLRAQNQGKPKWSFLDGPITANNPMGVHHAWGRTYKDAYQRYFAMTGHELRYQNGFDCQGLWVEVEVEKELNLGTKNAINEFGLDKFVNECKKRVLRFAARQTEQSIRLGFWMEWDDPDNLRKLAETVGTDEDVTITMPSGSEVTDKAHHIVAKLGNPQWGGSYFTFSTENNETIWTFLKKCFTRGKIYRGYDVMPWSGRGGSAYSQMEVADGRKLAVHKSCFVRFPIRRQGAEVRSQKSENIQADDLLSHSTLNSQPSTVDREYLLVWTTTPWTLTSNVAAAVNPDLEYVKLRSKRDDAVYYFAKDNLDYQRLNREFKEGFGRPEWSWPKNVPKLKTIGQIFKEQGGYEIEDTLKGTEMVGWQYEGPFDDLPAQHQPGGHPEEETLKGQTGVSCHRVIDGGRDFKGNPHVVAGEGTGIVHIAPGCGDVDHQLGAEHGLVGIAPLGENGRFEEGFGDFTGKEAIDPQTAELVFEKLREKHLLVNVEQYPHIYPHCWRTGDELVFRLVDEWFINMDWREEIKDVTQSIRWLPDSVDGKKRELEWLANMRDWMISKKRFWGLALPIWFDEETGDFEVIGSLAELKERAVEGWDEFEGHTPHRPWIDNVKIKHSKTGNLMSRIVDVGNPWLDAGIVSFSTMHYNTDREEWQKWYPADFVTECFPGQFRNWFYSLLSLATMMNYDDDERKDDPLKKRPFKTLLGHRLVTNEQGKPMHKTDGTAIWFEEAAEQIGVDTIRWMYLAHNPASDLRFGTRHHEKPVTLQTPDGPATVTKEGLPICLVTSKPADEIRRQILIPLWNSYAFFVNYARLDEFDPHSDPVPVRERPEIDRWILSNLQALIEHYRNAFEEFDSAQACLVAANFIDDLSNWYIRRNRRRFWRSKDASDTDKLAAYQTLHEVLVTLSKLLAPMIPFLAERMYQNLVCSGEGEAPAEPQSVHLCEYPRPDGALLDTELNRRMATAQLIVKMGHKLREESSQRVRQPLAELRYACDSNACGLADPQATIESLVEVIKEELNIKQITACDNLDDLVSYSYKPNLKTLGPRYGKLLGALRKQLPEMDSQTLAPLRSGQPVTISIDGTEVTLEPDDVLVSTEQAADWVCADDRGIQIALSTVLTPELVREGMRNDFIRQVQNLRKEADLEIQDRINISWSPPENPSPESVNELTKAIDEWSDYIKNETLADSITSSLDVPHTTKPVNVGEIKVPVWIEKV